MGGPERRPGPGIAVLRYRHRFAVNRRQDRSRQDRVGYLASAGRCPLGGTRSAVPARRYPHAAVMAAVMVNEPARWSDGENRAHLIGARVFERSAHPAGA